MKKIDFEDCAPLFSKKEMCDAISCIAMCITQAVTTNNLNANDWDDYIGRWCIANNMPDEISEHMSNVLIGNFESIKRHE